MHQRDRLSVSFFFFFKSCKTLRSFKELHIAGCLDIVTYKGLQSLTKEERCVFIMSCILNTSL